MIKEICDVMFCLDIEKASNDPQYKRHSIFEVDESLKAEFDQSYFNNNEMIVNDVSFGQRNYKRNLDGILDVLVKPRQNHKDPKKFKQQEL